MKRVFGGFLVVLALAGYCSAQDFGIVTDTSGKIADERAGKTTFLDIGAAVAPKDKIHISKGGSATIVEYATCQEWFAAGAGNFIVDEGKIVAVKGASLKMGKKLPVCYKPGEIKGTASHSMGGIALFAKESKGVASESAGTEEFASTSRTEAEAAMQPLREEYQRGNASNATVIALMMYELNANRMVAAKPYYDDLKKRAPKSQVVRELAERFAGEKN